MVSIVLDPLLRFCCGDLILPSDRHYGYFLFVQLHSTIRHFKKLDKSTTIPSLAKRDLLQIKMPVPPIMEQRRIVSRIEELFSKLDKGVETLQTIKQQLAVYRQAVLKEVFNLGGAVRTVKICEIVDEIRIGPFGTMLHKEDYITDGIPVINPQHIKNNAIVANNKISVSKEKAEELALYRLRENDIIMGRRGEMGRCAPVSVAEAGWICGTGSIRFRMKNGFSASFYAQILSSPDVVHYLEEHATGTTMKNLNEEIVKHIPIPYITVEMQKNMNDMIKAKTLICDSIERTVNEVLTQADAMRQSILKQAFEGEI